MLIYSLKLYFRNFFNVLVLVISICLNIFTWIWLAIQIKAQTEPIFLHYNILFGIDYIDVWWKVYYLPMAGIIIILLNTFLGWWLFNRDKLIGQLLHSVTLLAQVFLLIVAVLLVFLNV